MNLNRKILIPTLILLVISWTLNTAYYKSHMLKEPLFLKHYYDIKRGMPFFDLYYIDNIDSKVDIAGISFPEIGQGYVEFNRSDSNTDRKHYKTNIISVVINRGNMEDIPEYYKNKLITKVQVQFTNGKVMDVDIGKIYLYSEDPGSPVVKTNGTPGSNDSTVGTSNYIEKYTKINGAYSKFPEIVGDVVRLSINGKALENINFPLELEMGNMFQLKYCFNFKENDIRRNYVYAFSIDFTSEDRLGDEIPNGIYLNYYPQSTNMLDINALKKDRGY